jgi:hypothetical protein
MILSTDELAEMLQRDRERGFPERRPDPLAPPAVLHLEGGDLLCGDRGIDRSHLPVRTAEPGLARFVVLRPRPERPVEEA